VVRLEQGAFHRQRDYGDPVEAATAFRDAGAAWLHVVDLDGARTGTRHQTDVVAAIVAAVGREDRGRIPVRIQLAGGLRDAETVTAALEAGASRVVIGTAALHEPALVDDLVRRHGPSRIAVALDVRNGIAVGNGWLADSPGVPVIDALRRVRASGVETLIVTAIARDGLLQGPDLGLLERVIGEGPAIVASGGVASIADLEAVRDLGCSGAVIGRALYDGGIDLVEALASVSRTGRPLGTPRFP
jgi:phosphoribosylformimino-5-aminoimidazole carboxamide ribotide isomerase